MLYLHHTSSFTHDPRALCPEHPDSPLRIEAIENAIAESTLPPLTRLSAPAATFDELRLVHSDHHIEAIRAVCERGAGQIDDERSSARPRTRPRSTRREARARWSGI
jgi:acetoin utilization deacetylase AcuC-like enzyme